MHARRLRRRSAVRQRGAVAIMLGITLAVLIGFAGLALDLGRFFIIKSELQNAMDACALAASSQLRPGQSDPNALTRAIAYGRVFTTGGVSENPLEGNIAAIQNRVALQNQVVNVLPENITFSEDLDGPYVSLASADPNTAAFVQCSLPLTDIPVFFMRVLNPLLTTQTVSAQAVATLAPSASTCAIPVAVCRSESGTAANNFGLSVGMWLNEPGSDATPGSTYGTGNFGWIDFSPTGGGSGGGGPGPEGSTEVTDLLTGTGQCSLTLGSVVGQGGELGNQGARAWNSRFGVYQGGGGSNPSVATAPPDRTGYGYNPGNWTIGQNAYSGSVAGVDNYIQSVAAYRPYQGPLTPGGAYSSITSAQHQALGRLRRLAVAPVVNCNRWNTGGANPAVEGWACVLMLHPIRGSVNDPTLEFRGLSTTPGSPCATNGEPGTFGPLVPQLVQ